MPRPLLCLFALCAPLAVGCGAEPPVAAQIAPAPSGEKPADFQPGACGEITGAVTWVGPVPVVPPITDIRPRNDGSGTDTRVVTPPNAPRVDNFTRALGGTVVYLRGVVPARAKPWDLPPVGVEMRDDQILVTQGARVGRTGFVRRGEPVTMQSREPVFHSLRGRGAAFFALAFPEPNRSLERAFDTYGRVQLTSAAGFYWQAADLFVCDHPYYAVTDAEGRFRFAQVPDGKYELVAWHPNWVSTGFERNPENTLIARLDYAPPLEAARPVMVAPGRVTLATLTLPK